MKKVLLITYAWPPKGGVGVIRALKFAKYLPQFGWQPVIITTGDKAPGSPYREEDLNINIASFNVTRTDYKELFKWMPDRLRRLILLPDIHRGWFKHGYNEAMKVIEKEKIDAVFSTSPSETAHLIAQAIKNRFGIPWVADLRDLWSGDHFETENFLRKAMLSRMERDVFKDADVLTTVSDLWAKDLSRTSNVPEDRIKVLMNGFDDDDFNRTTNAEPKKFTLVYTGKLHRTMQDPEILIKAVRALIDEGKIERSKVEIKFYVVGFRKADISEIASRYRLSEIVLESEGVSYKKAIEIQKNSTMLLFFQWKGAVGWYSAKIFDYIGSGRPILAISEKGSVVEKLITDLSAGYVAHSEGELKEMIKRSYDEFNATGTVKINAKSDELKKYTRREITRNLAGLLDNLVTIK